MIRHCLAVAIVSGALLIDGCSPPQPPIAELPAPEVSVARPITDRPVHDSLQFLATLAATEKIDVRARVTGYLTEIKFKAGDAVKKGQVLFVIDRRPFAAAYKKADGELKIAEAEHKLAEKDYARSVAANAATPGAVSKAEVDKASAQVEVWQAQIDARKAARDESQINLDFTEVKADVDGKVGRNLITAGNLVNADTTILTTIVNNDSVYAYFDADQPAVVEYRRKNPPKKENGKASDHEKVELWLDTDLSQRIGNKSGDPYIGEVDFANVELNANTGALQIRAIFKQKDLKNGLQPLESGFTARLRVAIGADFKPILVPDVAIGTDQEQKYVYVVNAENKVEYRKVTLGNLYDGNLRAIASGLTGSESVIVNGLQRVRPGIKIAPDQVDPITQKPLKDEAVVPTKK